MRQKSCEVALCRALVGLPAVTFNFSSIMDSENVSLIVEDMPILCVAPVKEYENRQTVEKL